MLRRAGTEKRAGERYLPSRCDSTRKGTHHVVKRPNQAGIRVPARGPSHLHPTRGTNLNPATTRSYVEVLRGAVPRSGLPTVATGPPHNIRYNVYPRAPTYTSQHPPPQGAPAYPRPSTYGTHHATQHPPQHEAPRPPRRGGTAPPPNNPHHPPQPIPPAIPVVPCAPCVGKVAQHVEQGRKGEGRGNVMHSPKGGLSAGIWRQEVVMCPVGEKTPQVDIPGPTSCRWGEVPHRRLGMATWTHVATGEGSCLPLCGLDTEK